ncbi:hypothetical protein KM043_004788 [Ampulex compressa]|nr:hypothetical protein KM043_004788 [Ampulex compressa]
MRYHMSMHPKMVAKAKKADQDSASMIERILFLSQVLQPVKTDFQQPHLRKDAFPEFIPVCEDNESRLTDAERMRYLKLSVRGPAAALIKYMSLTSGGFEVA